MGATRDAKHPREARSAKARPTDDEAHRRLAIEAAMLVFLIGLALAFVASAPS